jgi:hypothetical protein
MELYLLYLCFGTKEEAVDLKVLQTYFASNLPGLKVSWVCIDNSPFRNLNRIQGVEYLHGDNTYFEFSGWENALCKLSIDTNGFYLFVTSAYKKNYTGYLNRLTENFIFEAFNKNQPLGHVDLFKSPVQLAQEKHFQYWLRTAFFFLPGKSLALLDGRLASITSQEFATEHERGKERDNAPVISEEYREKINDWLTGRTEVKYHNAHSNLDKHDAFFKRKFLSIINEHLLSVRLRSLGFKLMDIDTLYLEKKLELLPLDNELDRLIRRRSLSNHLVVEPSHTFDKLI